MGCRLHTGDEEEETTGPFSIQELRKYVAYCKSRCSPRLTKEAADFLRNHYVSIRKKFRQESKSAIPITVRQLEALVRISEAHAKMQLLDDVSIEHVEKALTLFT